jgi:hypothetical protein
MNVTHDVVEWLQRLGQLGIWSALALGLFFAATSKRGAKADIGGYPRGPDASRLVTVYSTSY